MYLNIIQLAESFGVTEAVIEGWVRAEGLPCVRDRSRLLFDRAEVTTWAAAHGLTAQAGFLATARPRAGLGLAALLQTGGIWREVPGDGVLAVLEQIVARLPGAGPPVRQLLGQRLRAAQGVSWASIGGGLALPHLRTSVALGREAGLVAVLLLKDALRLAEPPADGVPVTRLIFFIAPSPRAHLEMLALLSAALTRGRWRQLLLAGAPDAELIAAADEAGLGVRARPPSSGGGETPA